MIIDILEVIFAGMCVGLASSVTVGPVAVLCIQRTLSKGLLSGFISGLGVAFADALLAILAFTVFSLIKDYIDEYHTAIQVCAGIFVIIVGIFIFFKNPVPQIRKNRAGKTFLWQDFVSMFGFTLANFVVIIPYILAFFAMFHIDLSGENKEQAAVVAVEEVAAEEPNLDAEVLAVDGLLAQADVDSEVAVTTELEDENQTKVFDSGDPVADAIVGAIATAITEEMAAADTSAELDEQNAKAVNMPTAVITRPGADVSEKVNVKMIPADDSQGEEDMSKKFGNFVYSVLIIIGFLIGAMAWWLALTAVINLFRKGFRPRHMLTINHIAGVVIGVLGLYTLLSVLI